MLTIAEMHQSLFTKIEPINQHLIGFSFIKWSILSMNTGVMSQQIPLGLINPHAELISARSPDQ